MKHIKLYEKHISKKNPHVGDYILANVNFNILDDSRYIIAKLVQKFLNNNIGKIISFRPDGRQIFATVEYKNIPIGLLYVFDGYDLKKNTISVNVRDIVAFSKNKKDIDVEAISTAKKYNL